MPRKTFTDRWLKTVGPFAKTREFVDAACPNLWVRVGRNRKSFSVMIGSAKHRRRLPLGHYPTLSILEARRKALEILSDPRAPGGGRPRKVGRTRKGSVQDLFEFVVVSMEDEGKTASVPDYRLYLLEGADAAVKDFGPSTPAANVTPEMVTDWLAKFHARGRSTRLPRAMLSAAFNRGIKADNDPTKSRKGAVKFGLVINPVSNVGGPTQSNTRDRSLSIDELKTFWAALDGAALEPPTSLILRLIIAMGGVRVTEIIRSEKSWWRDDGGWKSLKAPRLALPKTKNGHPHDLPVTRRATQLLKQARKLSAPESIYLFNSASDIEKPRTVDSIARRVRDYCQAANTEPFTPRDLRRTMKNLLLENDVAQADVDIWHNHGRNADVARRNYDRAQYEHAKGRVMKAIDRLLRELEKP